MATLSPQFFQLLEAEQKMVFFDEYDMQESMKDSIFLTKPSTKAYEDRIQISGLGTFIQKPEGTPISYDDPAQGLQVRTSHQTFGLGWRATMEAMEDDQFGIMKQMSRELAQSAADHRERLGWGLVNDGFTGTTYTGLEGDVLFTTAHTLLKGTAAGSGVTDNRSNVLNPAVALGITGIETLTTQMGLLQSDNGRYIMSKGTTLVIHPNLNHQAYVLLNSEYKPGSTDNDRSTVNSTRNGWKVVTSPYLTSQTNWFVFSAPDEKRLVWNNRKDLTFFRSQDSDTQDQKFGAIYRASVMFSDWRGSWASQS